MKQRCSTKFCRGRVDLEREHSPYCSKCRSRRFKESAPLKYAFGKLRARARERGHVFTLTFEDYERFAIETGYDKLKGKTKYSLSIHRRDSLKGYEKGNILAVTLSLNSRIGYANLPEYVIAEMREEERKALAAMN